MSDSVTRANMFKAYSRILFIIVMIAFVSQDLKAQYYEFSMNQRRRFDQIHVEIWARKISANAPKIGYASLVLKYNSDFLTPSTVQYPLLTDSIINDIDRINPIVNISSQFNNAYGYSYLGYQNYGIGFYSLELNLQSLGSGGLIPDSLGRGSFVGKMIFDIINNPPDTVNTEILWSSSSGTGQKVVFDTDSTNLTSQINFIDQNNFKVVGVTILTPNFASQVVDRDKNYLSLTGKYAGGGYPLYLERSVSPTKFLAPNKTTKTIDEDLSYVFDYSLDNGNSWSEIGRVSETEKEATQTGTNLRYRSGEIFNPNVSQTYLVTSQSGYKLTDTNYREPIRVIWAKNPYFIERSEEARLKVSILNGNNVQNLTSRTTSAVVDTSNEKFVLGRLFFLQLNGSNEYLRTEESFSNSTQLTVSAWINLNNLNAVGSSPAIVASSLGPEATSINGSTEGAWMLYLKDGRFPAFRAREMLARGDSGYIANLYDVIPLRAESDINPLNSTHSENWVHLAATVKNNEIILYVNGEIVEKNTNLNATDIRMLTTNHPIWIGVNPNGTIDATDYVRTGIKEVQVWRTALTQEQIRQMVPGIVDPWDVSDYGDLRRGLELYYNFEGSFKDVASDNDWQNGEKKINLVRTGLVSNLPYYRPDQPHIKLTAPTKNSGVLNKEGELFEIRWVSYGLGDITTSGSKDIELEYSADGGNSWYYVKNPATEDLGGNDAPDVELSKTLWEAWENNNANANLRSIEPYSHRIQMRIRGTALRSQQNLMDISDTFTVARYFSFYKTEKTVLSLPSNAGMNITGDNFFIETWIRPYRFPTIAEGFMTIISKQDSTSGTEHYTLKLLSTGQLQFTITDAGRTIRTATSDLAQPLVSPNSIAIDTAWTHIGVYVFLNGGVGASEIRFYIDGKVQRESTISSQLGNDITVDALNKFPTFIGYEPGGAGLNSFIGEIRELRFWDGTPNNTSAVGNEPTEMTLYLQGALAVRAEDLSLNNYQNLFAGFSFNGRSYVYNGYSRAIGSLTNISKMLRVHGEPYEFKAVKPYIKLVEPEFKQKVANTKTDLKVRWVGFDFNGEGFMNGGVKIPPALEFSIRGGGGNVIQPYQYIGSKFWDNRQVNAMTFPETDTFLFNKTASKIYFATKLDVSKSDPDGNNDGKFDDQGAIAASLTNARLRLTGTYTINAQTDTLVSEGPLFSITPQTNFTVRVLLEGRHDGILKGSLLRDLPSKYDLGGIKIKVYTDNAGTLGKLVDSSESEQGYFDRDPDNRNKNTNRFANVNFVFTDLADDYYWVVVDQINHLPVMSRFPAPFVYEGDEVTTWTIESGWDFTSWNGKDENIMKDFTLDPYFGNLYSAYGDAYTTTNNPRFSTTGLVFNDGRGGSIKNAMPAMVGGDVTEDGQINAADRIRVRLDDGTSLIRSDVTGDGFVNADDRTITDRNFGKVSSIYNVDLPEADTNIILNSINKKSDLDLELSDWFINNANNYLNSKKTDIKLNDKIQASGISYVVKAEIFKLKDTIKLSMFLKNTGFDFNLANATFPVEYNTNAMNFLKLSGSDSVVFSNKPLLGYSGLRTAPEDSAINSLPNVRTIEVDYDAFARLKGERVSRAWTYLGTLDFALKSNATSVKFAWHDSKSVHTTDSLVITGDGVFEEIPANVLYSAEVETPNGGESYGAERKINVKWESSVDANVFLEYTTNSGINWIRINQQVVSSNLKSIDWITPKIYSSNYLIRIIDAETGIELDRSNDKFSIAPNSAALTRPSAFDGLYHGGVSDSIKWNTKGYDLVRLEFSSDGGATWISVTSSVDATKSFWKWIIPKVTTKSAYIRMIDLESGNEIAKSGKFKILNGNMSFRTPRKNEIFYTGKIGRITWNSSDVAYFDMQLSTDGGNTWDDLKNNLLAIKMGDDWSVPQGYSTDNAILRAIWNGDPEMVYATSQVFSIRSTSSVEDNLPPGFEVSELFPNPCEKIVKINITAIHKEIIVADILNIAGCKVKSFENLLLNEGSNSYEFDIADLPSGKFYIHFKGTKLNLVRELNILK